MKKSAFNKLLALGLILMAACKGQIKSGNSNADEEVTKDSTATESSLQTTEKQQSIDHSRDSTAVEKTTREIPKAGNETPASQHNAPNQERIDSIKRVKTNSKRKAPD